MLLLVSYLTSQAVRSFYKRSFPIDLCHSTAMLSLRRIKNFVFARPGKLALNSRLAEACRAKTKLFIPLRLNTATRDKGLQPILYEINVMVYFKPGE